MSIEIYEKLKNKKSIPWVEKYRPSNIEELIINKTTLNKLNSMIKNKCIPNIIITGVPGIGKTTTILCLAKLLLGKYVKHGVLEMNASDERGIKAVQDTIIHFCRKKLTFDKEDLNKYCNHKIILLDEADNMTKKAQQLVNNLMEQYHNTTRFAFTCNNSTDLIESIQSRCIILRYKRLSNSEIKKRLEFICKKENIEYTKDGIDTLIVISQGDMRQAINSLQLTYDGFKKINNKNIYKLCDKPHPLTISNIFTACYKNDIKNALIELQSLWEKGYSGSDISLSMLNVLRSYNYNYIPENIKILYSDIISRTCMIISKGIDTKLQLTGCIAEMCNNKNISLPYYI